MRAPMALSSRGEVGDLGLAGAVLQHRLAVGEDGGHEQVLGAGDGDLVEGVVRLP